MAINSDDDLIIAFVDFQLGSVCSSPANIFSSLISTDPLVYFSGCFQPVSSLAATLRTTLTTHAHALSRRQREPVAPPLGRFWVCFLLLALSRSVSPRPEVGW